MANALSIVRKFYPNVKSIKDATKPLVIEVTPADVKTSRVKSHRGCALAVACKRKMHLDGAVISRSIGYLVKDRAATRYLLPESATREVVAFDRGGTFEPGDYKLMVPHENVRLGQIARKPQGRNDGSRPRKAPRHLTANIRTTLAGQAK